MRHVPAPVAANATAPRTPRLPPGPSRLEVVLGLRAARRDLLAYLVRMTDAHGDVVRLSLGPESYVLIRRPEHIRQVAQRNYENYTRDTRAYDLIRLVEGSGLPRIDGDAWRRRRRLAQPLFRPEVLATFAGTMTDATAAMLDRWAELARLEQVVDVSREASALTLQIIGRTMFGAELGDQARAMWQLLSFLQHDILRRTLSPLDALLPGSRRLPTPRNRAFWNARRELDRIVAQIIDRSAHADPEAPSLLRMLREARADGGDVRLTDGQLRDEIVAYMIAGHETTAAALTWTWYELSIRPDVESRLRAEVAGALGSRVPTFDDCAALPYAKAVFQESMRVTPPVWLKVNRCQSDDDLGGFVVPAGSTIVISPYLTHRVRDHWPNPEAFSPERFLDAARIDPFAYIPFGGGPHICIGKEFATVEAQLILAMVAQRFELHLVPGTRVDIEPHITLRPRGGMPMTIHAIC
jgi:cytochrome P450